MNRPADEIPSIAALSAVHTGPDTTANEPAETVEIRVLVNSRTHDEDLLSLARWLPTTPDFAGRIRILGQLPETGSFDILNAVILLTVPSAHYQQTPDELAKMNAQWHYDRAIRHLLNGELNAPVVVTVVFPNGASTATEGD